MDSMKIHVPNLPQTHTVAKMNSRARYPKTAITAVTQNQPNRYIDSRNFQVKRKLKWSSRHRKTGMRQIDIERLDIVDIFQNECSPHFERCR